MKKSLIFLLALSLVIFACDKEIENPTEASDIQISVTKNGIDHNPKYSTFSILNDLPMQNNGSHEFNIILRWTNNIGVVNEVLNLGSFVGSFDKQKPKGINHPIKAIVFK